MYTRKIALSYAKQYRTCPPPYIAENPSHKECLERHFAICPYCSDQVMEDRKNWSTLTKGIQERFASSLPNAEENKAAEGQLRYIRSDLARWDNGYFYNPPLVLILENKSDILVAQTYHDIYLAGPGDLILSSEQTETEELFAECWNTYYLKPEYLEAPTGKVGPGIIEAIRKLRNAEEDYPSWALHPKPLTEHDPRIYFRELEIEVSGIFADYNAFLGAPEI